MKSRLNPPRPPSLTQEKEKGVEVKILSNSYITAT